MILTLYLWNVSFNCKSVFCWGDTKEIPWQLMKRCYNSSFVEEGSWIGSLSKGKRWHSCNSCWKVSSLSESLGDNSQWKVKDKNDWSRYLATWYVGLNYINLMRVMIYFNYDKEPLDSSLPSMWLSMVIIWITISASFPGWAAELELMLGNIRKNGSTALRKCNFIYICIYL